jgi:hypothetical protein
MRRRLALAGVLVVVLFAAACGSGSGSGSSGGKGRPSSNARLEIVSPTPQQTTGPTVTVKFNVIGGEVLPADQVSGPLRGDQGHIHVTVDGQPATMAFGTELTLNNLAPGPHSVKGEYVAVDHSPFKNPIVTAVVFEVKQ